MARPYPVALRERVVAAYEGGEGTLFEIAALFMIGVATVKRWWWLVKKMGSVEPLPPGGGQPARIDGKAERALKRWLAKKPDLTLEELVQRFQCCFHLKVSQAAVSRTVLRLGLVRKKKSFHATEADSDRVKLLREEYLAKTAELDPRRLVFLDETGCRIGMARDYGRGLPGERVMGDRPASYGGNVTIIGAIGLDGVRAMMTVSGSADGVAFEVYVKDVLTPALKAGDIVVLDNLKAHLMPSISKLIEACGASLINLSPYSPDFNPIEECWSKLKSILRSLGARTRKALDKAVAAALKMITAEDCRGWFAHSGYAV